MQVYINSMLLINMLMLLLLGKTSILERIKSSHGLASLKPEQIPPTVGEIVNSYYIYKTIITSYVY